MTRECLKLLIDNHCDQATETCEVEYLILLFLVDCHTAQTGETICSSVNVELTQIGRNSIFPRDLRRRKAVAGLAMRADNIVRKISNDTWRLCSLSNGYILSNDPEVWRKSESRLSSHRNSESQTLSDRKLTTKQIQAKQSAEQGKQNQISLL